MSDSAFDLLTNRLSSLKLDDGLTYLNFVLQAAQDPDLDPTIYSFVQEHPDAVTDFKVEFLAKWLILRSSFTSPVILSPSEINWKVFLELSALYNRIDDPIVHAPGSQEQSIAPLFIRMLNQQLPGQERIALQAFGSAHVLFQETGAKMASVIGYDVPGRFHELTGLSVVEFMRLGQVFSSLRAGSSGARGRVTRDYMETGRQRGLDILAGENIERFLNLASCDYDRFRHIAAQEKYRVEDPGYILYEFNPLRKYPLVQIHPDRWVAPNPLLVTDRVTWGIYYDLLDADGTQFTEAFGFVFQEYVGDLLKSIYPDDRVFPERAYGRPERRGPADWTVIEDNTALLFECKSLIPNLSFVSLANQASIQQYAERVAGAVAQTHQNIQEIRAGREELKEFHGLDPQVIVLTLGRVYTANTVFYRPEIDALLASQGFASAPYVVLSLQELEHLLSLVERGVSLVELLERLQTENQYSALQPYSDMLAENALPSLIRHRGSEVIEVIQGQA